MVTASDLEDKKAIQVLQDLIVWKRTFLPWTGFYVGDLLGMWCRMIDVATSGFERRLAKLKKQ